MKIFLDLIIKFLSSQLFANILLLITLIVALAIGYRQILLNDVVEIYATPSVKQVMDREGNTQSSSPIINIQNAGTRLVYMDKYIFNGIEYLTHGQVLPPTYSQANAIYWIDLPGITTGINHVSVTIYYHDLDSRYWKSDIVADFIGQTWKVLSLPRITQ